MSLPPIRLRLRGSPTPHAENFLSAFVGENPNISGESQLLREIRDALRGAPAGDPLLPQKRVREFRLEDKLLSWTDRRVVLSQGEVIKRQWDFTLENQKVEYACIGKLEYSIPEGKLGEYDYMFPSTSKPSAEEKTPFGPFRESAKSSGYKERVELVSTVFIFLRRIGMAFMDNGSHFTFTIPFVVRAAWPLSPFGVLIQRSVDPSEFLDADDNDPILPTIYTLSSAIGEISALGVTQGIFASPPELVDEYERSHSQLPTIPYDEWVVWVAHAAPYNLLVTFKFERDASQLTVWRYQYIKPKSAPQPLPRERIKERARKRQSIAPRDATIPEPFSELPPLSALPDMPPKLTGTVTMQSLMPKEPQLPSLSDSAEPFNKRRTSLSDSLGNMRMDDDTSYLPIEHGRMKTSFWAQKLTANAIMDEDYEQRDLGAAALFDNRWDGEAESAILAVQCPGQRLAYLYRLVLDERHMLVALPHSSLPSESLASAFVTREGVLDLLVVAPNRTLSVLTTRARLIPLIPVLAASRPDGSVDADRETRTLVARVHSPMSTEVVFDIAHLGDWGKAKWTAVCPNLSPRSYLASRMLQIVALCLTEDVFSALHQSFLAFWSEESFRSADDLEFDCLARALYAICGIEQPRSGSPSRSPFHCLATSPSHSRFLLDSSFRQGGLELPSLPRATASDTVPPSPAPSSQPLLAPILYALHTLAENMRLVTHRYKDLLKLASVICQLAIFVRPEWADYWRRLCPSSCDSAIWPGPQLSDVPSFDDRIPVWPPDISAILYGRISNPDWQVPSFSLSDLAARFAIKPSYAFGRSDPLEEITSLTELYKTLSDPTATTSLKRAEGAVRLIAAQGDKIMSMLDSLPLGVSAPLREAIRTCQLHPETSWADEMYHVIEREEIAATINLKSNIIPKDGYKGLKEFVGPKAHRHAVNTIISEANTQASGEIGRVTGVELEYDDFTEIRFGQDRRLEDVAHMLDSSRVATYRQILIDRPEQASEADQNKEYQSQALRIAERVSALTYGRAMFTYGVVTRVNRESYTIPQMCYNIRIHPHNVQVNLDTKLMANESITWGEFHNGVAAGLRISPYAEGVEGSWISFNKPGDLSAGHAGFLFGLGLSGHLKQMVAWNTFQYLTPKHDLTSIGVLLGLSSANVGTGNRKVTKLLAVHTPALLPTPSVDLNISLMTQSAGLIGMGLLYMGTKHRRYAEVCLKEISRKDLVEANLHSEYRETYTTAAALGFGMIMLGRGSTIPADIDMVDRLNILIHGESLHQVKAGKTPSFDVTMTSPAATIALGLMYLRTERRDVADMLTMPDTAIGLNRIQPGFLLIRVLARSLIMWNEITPSMEWLQRQIPQTTRIAIETRVKNGTSVDDALELAYYNIIAGCCFVVALKYAGTARQEAYKLIIRHYDLFTRLVYSQGPTFDHRIKRSAVRDGLNLLSVSLSMVMAGTGEITSFRRLRYAYGMFNQTMYHPSHKYGIHVATYQSIGLLFLGGGRFNLGTSDAAIASMVISFFPRYQHISSDNKVYLQALRHLWVLAVEPRCLIARDIQTKEVVYLPLKLSIREGRDVRSAQLISPTLIPDMNEIAGIRLDSPRYWPFFLDLDKVLKHRQALIRSQTVFVKRRTAFLSYTEDPRGSRSLLVRMGASSTGGEAAILDYPQLTDTTTHPASDLSDFITSFSNDPIYLAFAAHMGAREGDSDTERLFFTYAHAALYDSILQGKQQALQSHLTLFLYRNMKMQDPYFHLRLQDLRFAADFYSRIFDRRFSGKAENNQRTPLIRDGTIMAALFTLDQRLDEIRADSGFMSMLGRYTAGERIVVDADDATRLAWYLLRNGVPVSTLLGILKTLAHDAYSQCFPGAPPGGTMDAALLDQGIKEVLHATGTKMTTSLGSGWSVRSLNEIVALWKGSTTRDE